MAKPPALRKTPGRKPRVKGRHMTSGERAECLALWAAGEATLVELAKKYAKSTSTINALIRREGVKKGQDKQKREALVQEAVQKQAITDAQKFAERITETKEEHYKMASGISKLIWNEIAEAKKEKRPLATAYHNIKTLKSAADALKTLRDERYTILGIRAEDDDENKPLPELTVRELTVKDIEEIQRREAIEAENDLGVPDIELGDEDLMEDDLPDVDDRVVEGEDQ